MRKQASCGICKIEFGYDDSQQSGKWCSNKCQQEAQYRAILKDGRQEKRMGSREFMIYQSIFADICLKSLIQNVVNVAGIKRTRQLVRSPFMSNI